MPKIETYHLSQEINAPNIALSNVRATAEAFGAAGARQIGQVGQITENIAGKVIDRNLQLESLSDKNRAYEALNNFETGLLEKRSELFKRKGKDAEKAYDDFNSYVEEQKKALSGTLENEAQRGMFSVSANDSALKFKEQMLKFRDASIEDNFKTQLDINKRNTLNTVLGDWRNDALIVDGLNNLDTQVKAANPNDPKEIIEEKMLLEGDNYLTQITKHILADPNGGAVAAKEFIDKHANMFTETGRLAIYKDISEKADMEKMVGVADSLKNVKDPLIVDKVIKNAFGKDPQMYSKTKALHADMQSSIAKAKANEEAELVDSTALQMAKAKDPREVKIPLNLDLKKQEELFSFQKKLSERRTYADVTNPATYQKLLDGIRAGENVNVLAHTNELTQEKAIELISMNSQARNKDPELARVMSLEDQKKAAYVNLGLDVKKKKDQAKIIAFNLELEKRLPEDRKLRTVETVQKVIDEMSVPAETSFFGPDTYRFMLPYSAPADKKRLYESARSETLKKENAEFYSTLTIGGKKFIDVYVTKAGKKGVIRDADENIIGTFSYTEGRE